MKGSFVELARYFKHQFHLFFLIDEEIKQSNEIVKESSLSVHDHIKKKHITEKI